MDPIFLLYHVPSHAIMVSVVQNAAKGEQPQEVQHEEHEGQQNTVVPSISLTAISSCQTLSLSFICFFLLMDGLICLIVDEDCGKGMLMHLL